MHLKARVAGWGCAIAATLVALTPVQAQPTPQAMPLGMNLAQVADYSREWVFVDVFKSSRPWIPQRPGAGGPWDTQETIRTDEHGWPILGSNQAAATLMCREIAGRYPGGRYVCKFEGSGDIQFGMDARVVSQSPGRIELDVTPSGNGIFMKINTSDPNNHIRNIRVLMPGFEHATSAFHPLFIERLRPFEVLRFMDWQQTTNSTVVTWEQRATPESARQTDRFGVALEHMIDLCNELDADPWFCMPHQADDRYVFRFARTVRSRLKRDLNVYVEWSNETWNWQFQQTSWQFNLAQQRGLQNWTWAHADEAARDWLMWKLAFRDRPERVIRTLAGQHYNPWVVQSMLERLNGDVDAISCAAYFYVPDENALSAATTAQDVIHLSLQNIRETGLPLLQQHKNLANEWSSRTGRSIKFVAYEGGQHHTTYGTQKPFAQAYIDAQIHPGMYDCYSKLIDGTDAMGCDLLTAFNNVSARSLWGSWGALEWQDQALSEAPKYRALIDSPGAR